MEYGIEKCAMAHRKSRKWQTTEGMELQNQEKIKMLREKETDEYLRILEVDIIKHEEKKLKKNTTGERENYSKPNNRNFIKVINNWAVSLIRYLRSFLK